jgi:uncharacterized protein YigE (DUF2233 family)
MSLSFRLLLCLSILGCATSAAQALECSSLDFEGRRATVCYVDVRADRLQMFHHDASGKPLNSFSGVERELASGNRALLFAMNAGMYHADYSPVGLLIADGREIGAINLRGGSGNFFLLPNGIFMLSDAGAQIVESSRYAQLQERATLATQSGPLLVQAGVLHPAFKATSTSRLIRNGVGIITRERIVFAISDDPVNFHEFARLFRDGLHCTDALYLDGTVSSLFSSQLGRSDHRAPLGPIIGIARAAEAAAP